MKITIKEVGGVKTLIIEAPLQTPKLSSTGKTFIVASSGGTVKTGVEYEGKPISLGLNAFFPAL